MIEKKLGIAIFLALVAYLLVALYIPKIPMKTEVICPELDSLDVRFDYARQLQEIGDFRNARVRYEGLLDNGKSSVQKCSFKHLNELDNRYFLFPQRIRPLIIKCLGFIESPITLLIASILFLSLAVIVIRAFLPIKRLTIRRINSKVDWLGADYLAATLKNISTQYRNAHRIGQPPLSSAAMMSVGERGELNFEISTKKESILLNLFVFLIKPRLTIDAVVTSNDEWAYCSLHLEKRGVLVESWEWRGRHDDLSRSVKDLGFYAYTEAMRTVR